MLKISASAPAEDDVAEAIAHYAAISPDLADAFEARLKAALSLLASRPDIGSRRFSYLFPDMDVRTWSLDRFPYRLFYAAEPPLLRVYRLEHEMRNVTRDTLGAAVAKKKGSAG
ncbi:MAG TPA: type II toxin-antitoxin system RelE/ParE family toxin [Telluria sp.]|nr:type II toxin-antitoxin system RelE/ParE family toxin [Telluria sp.]